METAINMQSVYVTDLVGIAILVIIMVTRGWSLPGRKLESRLMMALLAVSMFNCVADIYVFQCDGMPGRGYRAILMVGDTYLYRLVADALLVGSAFGRDIQGLCNIGCIGSFGDIYHRTR